MASAEAVFASGAPADKYTTFAIIILQKVHHFLSDIASLYRADAKEALPKKRFSKMILFLFVG